MSSLIDFDINRNHPRVPRPPAPFAHILLATRLRLALASLALARDPHVPAAVEQLQAALDQIEGE